MQPEPPQKCTDRIIIDESILTGKPDIKGTRLAVEFIIDLLAHGWSEVQILEKRKLTQAKAGEILGIDQSDVSRLKNGDFDRFSVERLFAFLNRLNRNVEIRITPADGTGGHQRGVAV